MILIASNGSASEQDDTVSFGWKISLLDATTLATHSDPAFGQALLFCTEGYGLLSVSQQLVDSYNTQYLDQWLQI
eukprot:7048445-Ditylum_brightwellii.AAC.1